jgi:O-glycosyl hydrolase
MFIKSLKVKFFCTLILLLSKATCVFAQQPVNTVIIDLNKKAQTMQNFGASGCWFSDPIGMYWADSVKNQMAELLFSKAFDEKGSPKGIGLSAWRFNIGAGTAEQGDSSGIKNKNGRVECFVDANGNYNWNKEQGYLWFVKKAVSYKVENLIAFVNSPPVYYTKNSLGYKTTGDGHSNLRDDKYGAYAGFLATVLDHFDQENIHFNFISPVNEPQWKWQDKYGEATQEGNPYTNQEIYKVAKKLDSALTAGHISTKILIPEAGMLTYLYSNPKNSLNGNQIINFWHPGSELYLGDLKHMSKFVAGHGYFTDDSVKNTIAIRQKLGDTTKKYGTEYWQSEYSMLGDGYKEGQKGDRSAFDCALFLAKLINYDLTYANASAWQFWNSWEPGNPDYNTRYYLLALKPSADFKSGTFVATKNLWILGQYSRFIRPGMVRIILPQLNDPAVLVSAYYSNEDKKLVLVVINNSTDKKSILLKIPKAFGKAMAQPYLTTALPTDNMKPCALIPANKSLNLFPRSVYTFVIKTN